MTFPASTKGGGMALGFPDVCKVPAPPAPPIPMPFPNMIDLTQAQGTSNKVKFAGAPVITDASEAPSSMGDEPGVAGGVVSGVNKGPGAFKLGAFNVKVEGNAVVTLLKLTAHNGSNANMPAGAVIVPSQTTVFIKG
jgi:hypothetical protein